MRFLSVVTIVDDIYLFTKYKSFPNEIKYCQNLNQYADLCIAVRFVTSDIKSIFNFETKMTNIFFSLKPLYVILIDEFHEKRFSLIDWFFLRRKKNAEELNSNRLILSIKNDLEKMKKYDMIYQVNTKGSPMYLKTTLSFGVQSGGMVSHSSGTLKALCKQYPDVHVYTTDYIADDVHIDNIHHLSLSGYNDFGELRTMYFNYSAYNEIMNMQPNRPSFIYERLSENNLLGLKIAHRYKVPLILEFNSSTIWTSRNWGGKLKYESITYDIERLNLEKATLITCVSDELKNTLIDMGIDASKILVNYNGVDIHKFNPNIDGAEIKEKLGIKAEVIIAFSGSFGKFHGAEKLAEAFGLLLKERPEYRSRTKLLFMGDGITLEDVRRTIKKYHMEDSVKCLGCIPFEQMPNYLAACDILVAPHVRNKDKSDFFGSPTKLFEYMAMGKAIAASDLNQIGKILSDGYNAKLFEPENVHQMKDTLAYLIDNSEYRKKLGENARKDAVKKYTWDKHVENILNRIQ